MTINNSLSELQSFEQEQLAERLIASGQLLSDGLRDAAEAVLLRALGRESPINKTTDNSRAAAASDLLPNHRCLHCGHTSDEAKVKPYAVEYHRFMSGILPTAFFPDGLNPLFNDSEHGVRLLEAALVEYYRIKSVGRVDGNIVSGLAHNASFPVSAGVGEAVPVSADTETGAHLFNPQNQEVKA